MMESQGIFQIHPKPRQEPEVPARCSIVALRPAGLIARFAPHLRVAVSATGRAPLRCLPVLAQNHATLLARPRYARTLRGYCAPAGAGARVTLGALPLRPRQEPEVPAPPGFSSKPCKLPLLALLKSFTPQTARYTASNRPLSSATAPHAYPFPQYAHPALPESNPHSESLTGDAQR